MKGIFISYRRDDTSGYSRLLYDRLVSEFGSHQVFMDVESIREPGTDFVDAINDGVGQCTVLLALIGRTWVSGEDTAGRRRLDDTADFVRLEIASALARDVRVIPVVVQGARMPGSDDLPDELKPLARRQALNLTHEDWEYDIGKLTDALARTPGLSREPAASVASDPTTIQPALSDTRPRRKRTVIISVLGTLAAVFLSLMWLGMSMEDDVAYEVTPEPFQFSAAETEVPEPTPVEPADLAGEWYDKTGTPLLIEQYGDVLRIGAVDPMTLQYAQIGSGSISGRSVTIHYTNSFGLKGTVTATLADDGVHLNGIDTVESTGYSESNTWHFGHLPVD